MAYVTNAQAGVDRVVGREAYMRRVPDLQAAGASLEITQAVAVDIDTVLAMVEIRAEREGSVLHNFAAFLARAAHGQITELWMVDAHPAYSERFWS